VRDRHTSYSGSWYGIGRVRVMLKKAVICAVVLVAPPLTLAQTVNDTDLYWLKVAIVAFTWTLGVGVGTVLSSDLGSEEERDDQD
jgi:hypothetical protein